MTHSYFHPIKTTFAHLLLLTIFILSSCSNDSNDSKYRSEPPTFSGLTLQSLTSGNNTIKAGEKFIITANQQTKGRLLNKSTYSWSISPNNEGNTQKYDNLVIYDNNSVNPTDTVVINTPGTYTITFTASYNASGNTTVWSSSKGASFSEYWNDGHVTYDVRGLYGFKVTIEKKNVTIE